jgi:membrane-associated phospholipid phosphatase
MNRMFRLGLLVFVSFSGFGGLSQSVWAQDGNAALPDSPTPSSGSSIRQAPENPVTREATWKSIPGDFIHDQKDIWWTFPTQLATGRHWIPTLIVTGTTAGLIVADPHVMPYFRKHAGNLDDLNDAFDPMITTGMVISVPAGLMISGYIRHDQRSVSSALLCAEAYADSIVPNLAIKAITRRERPSDIPPDGDFHNTFFNGGKSPFHGSSFPSGHATGAFSVATVVAIRYQRHRWVPWAAYALATAVSFSRITSSAHFPSDVFLGAAMGYSVARFQVLRPRPVQ